MSALDDVLFAAHLAATGGTAAARAELALLRRCRDAVVVVVRTPEWWRVDMAADYYGCFHCEGVPVDLTKTLKHIPDCPALAIDALAKEVRDARE